VRAVKCGATLKRMFKRNNRALPLHISLMIIGGVCLVVGNAVSLWANLRELRTATEWHSHTWIVVNRIDDVRTTLMDAEAGQRAFFATKNAEFLRRYTYAKAALPKLLAELDLLVADNPRQVALSHTLRQLTNARLAGMAERIALFQSGGEALAIAQAYDIGSRQTAGLRRLLTTMTDAELARTKVRAASVYRTYVQTNTLAGVMSVVVLLLLVLTYFLIDRSVRRREKAEQALQMLNASLEETVLHRTAQLSQLSARLQNIAEREKMALANELHDELGANLTAMNLDVAAVAIRIKDTHPTLAARLDRALQVLLDTVQLKRRIIHGLRPSLLDTLGLGSAVTALCEDYAARTGRPCAAQVTEELGDIDPEWPIALYRIAQECLTNITKHAQASEVRVVLSREAHGVRLRVVDDGIGIDHNALEKSLSHGLRGMRERVRQLGGLFVIRRVDECGTIAEAFLPFPGLAVSP
jgi:signal transduction histidine kinase